jgi:hypothetical protein
MKKDPILEALEAMALASGNAVLGDDMSGFAFNVLHEGIVTAAARARALLPSGVKGDPISEWAADIVRDL